MSKKIPWAFELYESGIMAETEEEAVELIKQKLREYAEMDSETLQYHISIWDQL